MMLRRTALLVGFGLLSGGARKSADCDGGAWQTLPPTPPLPKPDRTRRVDSNGARIFVAEFGRGAPVILLHGGLANANYWGKQISALSKGWRIVAMDLRGHGRSTLGDQALTYDLLAQDVEAVMNSLGLENAAIVGWSDGAIAGLSLASNKPRRVSNLFCFGANISQAGTRERGDHAPVFQQYLRRVPGEYRAMSPTPEGFAVLRAAMGHLWMHGSGLAYEDLSRIRARCRIVDGAHDEIILRSETTAITRAISGAQTEIIECMSHFGMLQDPSGFTNAIVGALDAT